MIMENSQEINTAEQNSPEEIPSLIKFISSNEFEGFDGVEGNNQCQPSVMVSINFMLLFLEFFG